MVAHVLPHKLTRIEFTSYAEGKGITSNDVI